MKKEKPVPLQELTMRDFFAAFALMGITSRRHPVGGPDEKTPLEAVVIGCYLAADMMMKEREK